MRRFVFYFVSFILILFLLEAVSLGMGVTPSQQPGQEPGQQPVQQPAVSSPPVVEQPGSVAVPDAKEPPKAIPQQPPISTLPEPLPAKPGETKPSEKLPTKTPAPAEVTQPAQEQVAPAGRPVPTRPSTSPRARTAAGGAITFFFDDADIFEVAHTVFGEVLRVNYIIDPKVKGRVTFRTVAPIPRNEVLPIMEIILRLNGIGFVEEQGLYRIVPLTEVSKELVYAQVGKEPEKVAIELFTFKNLNLKDSMEDIENAIGLTLKGGTVRVLPIYRLNALMVVASTKQQMEYVRKWIDAFDTMFAAARPKIYVYPLQNSKAAHIASLLQSIFSGQAPATTTTPTSRTDLLRTTTSTPTTTPSLTTPSTTTPYTTPTAKAPAAAAPKVGAAAVAAGTGFLVAPDTRVFADEIGNTLIILATPADYAFIEETIKKIDTQPRQVVIEGLIARVDLIDNLSFGFSWSFATDINISTKPFDRPINLSGDMAVNPGGLTTTAPTTGFSFVGTDSKGIVRAKLTAALKDSKAKILAAPHVLVSDNREARIQVGSQIPLATSTTTYIATSGISEIPTTSTVQYKDIGIILTVRPQVNDSGLVSLEISQEVSSPGDNVKIAGQEYTSINKTEATTNLVAQDGETIIIGGLIREDTTKSVEGIPFLSKIPILGTLFSNTTDNTTRTELIILLTPRVVKSQQDASGVTSDYIDKYKGSTKDKNIDEFLKDKGQKK